MIPAHPLSFGARFVRAFPLEIERDGQHQETIEGQLFQLDKTDAAEYKPVLESWKSQKSTCLVHFPFKYFDEQDPKKCLYALKGKINGDDSVLGYLLTSQGSDNEQWISCIEKAPAISGAFRIKNVLKALIYGYIEDQNLASFREGLRWFPTSQSIQAYDRLFKEIINRTPECLPFHGVSLMWLTSADVKAFMEQIKTCLLKEA